LRMLSNPMDLTVVAEMLSRGEQPDLFRLREQQYRIMAGDYKRTNLDQDFPLKAFSEHCYQLRLHDQLAISAQQFQKELLCMERHKLVVSRQSKGSDETVKIDWLKSLECSRYKGRAAASARRLIITNTSDCAMEFSVSLFPLALWHC
jgi:hypothetical protein